MNQEKAKNLIFLSNDKKVLHKDINYTFSLLKVYYLHFKARKYLPQISNHIKIVKRIFRSFYFFPHWFLHLGFQLARLDILQKYKNSSPISIIDINYTNL